MTQPARNRPRERVKPSTAQVCCWIGSATKAAALAHAGARGESLRALVERALVTQMAEDARRQAAES